MSIKNWLLLCIISVFCMIIIGGFTRLTKSGLSIVEWNPITGIILPVSEKGWNIEFDKYKKSPEFKFVNYNITMVKFKILYKTEYFHRLFGRIIGMFFFLPFLYYIYKKKISNQLIKNLLFISFLGLIQSFLGWYMVKSGLHNEPHVSHYKLMLHLTTATTIFILLYNQLLNHLNIKKFYYCNKKIYVLSIILLSIICMQLIYGGLLAGKNGGLLYNTFPSMDGSFLPEYTNKIIILDVFRDPGLIQFVHRIFAFIIIVLSSVLLYISKNTNCKKIIYFIFFSIFIQFILGVATLLSKVSLILALLHQAWFFTIIIGLVLVIKCYYKNENSFLERKLYQTKIEYIRKLGKRI